MQRSSRLGRLLALAGVAVWLGSPPSLAQAKPRKAGPDAGPAGKAPADGKSPPRVSLLRLQVIKPDPGPSETPAGFPRRHRFEAAPREGTTLTFLIDEPQQWIPFTIKVPCARSRRSPSSGRTARRSRPWPAVRGRAGPFTRRTTRSRGESRPVPSGSPCPRLTRR